ncbi:DUF1015 domain-containing protein [Mangrovibacterium marinum]|uniref:Uncharacterized protein (DUF1015 family) n=1 Tax=Mangrovibacterium marinum TaxID=1639118 RepID=A0A2T5C444_9BACT|nr:DUF1015 family protein [Mangrovibacterium marinum]PTN09564.1 uncharacterized protein (DUF1015 family) [Mangrovibacterium marinum]
MAILKPFRGLRPPQQIVEDLACLPYDVMNTEEAARMAYGKENSLLHITRAEIDCLTGVDIHSELVYQKAVANFQAFQRKGWLLEEEEERFYIYAQTMNGRTQYGLVGAAACEDYHRGVIKKHELTRPDKEEDRMVLTRYLNANVEPVFFSYKAVPEIDEIIARVVAENQPEYDFVAEDGFGHQFWVVRDQSTNRTIESLFASKVPVTYVADGHHRTAAAARVGLERKAQNPKHCGNESYNYFMAVHFPDNQLQIMDYNRLVKDLNGLSGTEFLEKLEAAFTITKKGEEPYKPSRLHEFSLYLDGCWYCLQSKEGTYNDADPIEQLDVTILSEQVLRPILNIQNLRTSKRIEFVGGIRGMEALKKQVDTGAMKAAFALFPVSMRQLIAIADSGNIMPPKTTWFEPKLRSGLVIHKLD